MSKENNVVEGNFVEEANDVAEKKAEPENGFVKWWAHNWGWVVAGLTILGTGAALLINAITSSSEDEMTADAQTSGEHQEA